MQWFDIPVKSLPRAVNFYEEIMGKKLMQSPSNPKVAFFEDQNGALYGSIFEDIGFIPDMFGIIISLFTEKKIADILQNIDSYGGKVLKKKYKNYTAGCKALIQDSEGNRIALFNTKQ